MTKELATTVTCLSGTRWATQMAEAPVGSGVYAEGEVEWSGVVRRHLKEGCSACNTKQERRIH
jgi:hypothetical protein